MKWKVKPIKYWKEGECRTVRRFALLPRRLSNNTMVWLEYYYKDQYYNECDIGIPSYWTTKKVYQ